MFIQDVVMDLQRKSYLEGLLPIQSKQIADLKVNSNLRESAYKTHIESLEAQLANSTIDSDIADIMDRYLKVQMDSNGRDLLYDLNKLFLSNQPINQESDS